MSANIFISFASQDRKVATTLCAALESRGFSCWISTRDINPGENFQIAIVRAIRNAKMMLLVFTSNSNASDEMSKELALASQQKLIVVPLRVEDVAPNEAFAYEFATRQWIDFFADWEAAINQLCVRLAQAMPPEQIAPPPTPPPIISPPAAPPPVAATPAAAAPPPVVAAPPPPAPPPPPPPPPPPVAATPPPVVAPPPVAKAPEPAVPPKAAQPAPKPAEPAKAEVRTPPPTAAKPAVAPTTASAPAPAKKGPPMGLFIAIGVVVLLIVGAVVALPMLGKKPAGQTAAAPSAAPALSAAASAAPPPSAVPATSTAPVSTASAAAGSAEPAASGAPSAEAAAAPVAPKHVHKPKAAAAEHATVKADVPY